MKQHGSKDSKVQNAIAWCPYSTVKTSINVQVAFNILATFGYVANQFASKIVWFLVQAYQNPWALPGYLLYYNTNGIVFGRFPDHLPRGMFGD